MPSETLDAKLRRQAREHAQTFEPGPGTHSETMVDPDLMGHRPDPLWGFLNAVFPERGSTPARPTAPLPFTNRSIDLMGGLDVLQNLAPESKLGAVGIGALLPPGWGRYIPEYGGDEGRRLFRSTISTPGSSLGRNIPMAANFMRTDRDTGVWGLNWLGPVDDELSQFTVRRGGSYTPSSHYLEQSGVRELIRAFQDSAPDAKWLTFHRVGGRAPAATNPSIGVDLRGSRPQFVRDLDAHTTGSRFDRYRAYMKATTGQDIGEPRPLDARSIRLFERKGVGLDELRHRGYVLPEPDVETATRALPPLGPPPATPGDEDPTAFLRRIREGLSERARQGVERLRGRRPPNR